MVYKRCTVGRRSIRRKIEWDYIAGALAFTVVWLLVGYPIVKDISKNAGVIVAYPLFLLAYTTIAFLFGNGIHEISQTVLMFFAGILMFDLIMPPVFVDFGTVPSQDTLGLIAPDIFFYTVFTRLGFSHTIAWTLTYPGVILACMLTLTYYLSGTELKKEIRGHLGL